MVDDFGIKYVGNKDALHPQQTLEHHYKVTKDWAGTMYISITLDWDYSNRKVHLSMPGYVKKALKQFQHEKRAKQQHTPYPCA